VTIQHYTYIQIKVKEQLVVRKDRDVNNISDYPTLHLFTNEVKEYFVVRKDIDVNEHE
jgi:hypothetical protein